MRIVTAGLGAWFSGLAMFWIGGKTLGAGPITTGDMLIVGIVSATCLAVLIPVAYVPLTKLVLSRVRHPRVRAVIALLSATLGVVPLSVVAWLFRDNESMTDMSAMLNGGSVLWLALFLSAGLAFAILYTRSPGERRA